MTPISPRFVDSNIRCVDNEGNLHAGARGIRINDKPLSPGLPTALQLRFRHRTFQELGTKRWAAIAKCWNTNESRQVASNSPPRYTKREERKLR